MNFVYHFFPHEIGAISWSSAERFSMAGLRMWNVHTIRGFQAAQRSATRLLAELLICFQLKMPTKTHRCSKGPWCFYFNRLCKRAMCSKEYYQNYQETRDPFACFSDSSSWKLSSHSCRVDIVFFWFDWMEKVALAEGVPLKAGEPRGVIQEISGCSLGQKIHGKRELTKDRNDACILYTDILLNINMYMYINRYIIYAYIQDIDTYYVIYNICNI